MNDAIKLLERCWEEWGSNTDGADDHVTQQLARDLRTFLDAETARAGWRAQFQPCPCGDQERPGHPMGWCVPWQQGPEGGFSRAPLPQPQLVVNRSVWPCKRTYPNDPDTAEDPCEDCGRDQRKHEIGPRPQFIAPRGIENDDWIPITFRRGPNGEPSEVEQHHMRRMAAAPPSPAEKLSERKK